jgi:predicted esterase
MKHILFLVLTLVLIPAEPIFSQPGTDTGPFNYDRNAALDLKEESVKEIDGIPVRDISFAANTPQTGRVKAYLVSPAGKGPFAGVIFFHWYGRTNGDRNQFVDEAVALAKKGTASLLIQGTFPWSQAPTGAAADRQRVINQTIEVRRSLDLLLAQPDVDRSRVAFVGHDYGAMYGAILANVDKRINKYILIAGTGSFSDWSLRYWLAKLPDSEKNAYRKSLNEVDPLTHIARVKSAQFLFQFARSDEHITKEVAENFYNSARAKKEIIWYDGKHELNVEAARQKRIVWLTTQLRLVAIK